MLPDFIIQPCVHAVFLFWERTREYGRVNHFLLASLTLSMVSSDPIHV